jgi:plastocyanin
MTKYVIAATILLCGAAVAGCGNSGSSTGNQHRPAGPQTWAVSAGSSSSHEALQALAFYPSSITVDAGDSVTWTSPTAEVHSITFPIAGQTPVPATDPSASAAAGGSTYNGTALVSSGFIAGGAHYTLTFPTAGTYTYYSIPQGFVTGTVIVQNAGAAYPSSQSASNGAAQSASTADLTAAQQSVASVPFASGSHQIAAGISPSGSAPAHSAVMRFMDGPTMVDNLNVTIPVGTTLTFKNLSNNVPHTVTFPAAGQTPPPGPPFQAAVGGSTYDGTALVNSGVIPPGGQYQLTFTATGTFTYYCLFHDDDEGMIGTVTVTP